MGDEPAKKRAKLEKAASGALQAASGALQDKFDANLHAGMLGLPLNAPIVSAKPSDNDIMSGRAPALDDWMSDLWKSVVFRLSVVLYEDPETRLRMPLHLQQTPPFKASKNGVATGATTYKERWCMKNCVTSLRSNGLYEASMSLWQFLPAAKEWGGVDLAIDAVSWRQYEACAGLWSKATLASSSENCGQARYIFPGFLPTCVQSVELVEEMVNHDVFFRDLPACGGQAVMWSLIGALDAALSDGDNAQTIRLYEASVTVTVRMRVAPSKVQLQLDSMGFIDVLRVQGFACGATSFFEFALAVLNFDQVTGQETGTDLMKKLDVLGVNFSGKPVSKYIAYGILALVGLADQGAGKESVRYLERISPRVFSDYTKISRSFQVLKKHCGPDEWKDALIMMMESIGVSLLSGDAVEDDFSVDFMVPKTRGAAGYVRGNLIKRKFVKWFLDEQIVTAASGASSVLSTAGLVAIKDKCCSPKSFWRHFHDDEPTEDVGSSCQCCYNARC